MEHFRRSERLQRGTYVVSKPSVTQITASILCPNCGEELLLDKHLINQSGTVSPIVKCTYPGCNFQDRALLEGWSEVYEEFVKGLWEAKNEHAKH